LFSLSWIRSEDKEAAMKMTVITDKAGKIVGAAYHGVGGQPGAGAGGPVAGPEQTVHVIEVPEELERVEDAGELHNKLQTLLHR
jgi:hypothetical protein